MNNFKNIILKNIIISADKKLNEKGSLEGITIFFSPISSSHIYLTSSKKVVNYFPEELETEGYKFDLNSFYDFMLALANSISTFMYELRKPINSGEMNIVSYSKFEKNKFIKINVTNHFYRKGNLGKDKVTISFFENDEDFGENELISFSFPKKDVTLLFALFRELISSEFRTKSLFIEASKIDAYSQDEIRRESISITKVDNSIVIDSIWLHGQELLNLMYVVDKLLYGFKIEDNLNSLKFTYRQISLDIINNIPYLFIKRMNDLDEDNFNKMQDGTEYYLKIPLAGHFLTILGLFIDIKVLRHNDIETELEYNTENITSKSLFKNDKHIKYHISTKESFLGLGVKPRKKKHPYPNIIFSGIIKENTYKVIEDGIVLNSMFIDSNGEKKQILNEFSINLKDQWFKFAKGLSIAYTQNYKKWEKKRNITKFFVTESEPGGWVKYEFEILSEEKNKVPAVLTITKYKMLKGGEQEYLSSFRQPLYNKYIYQLLTMFISLAEFTPVIEKIIEIDKKKLLMYKYKSLKTVVKFKKEEIIEYGFKRINDEVIWGVFNKNIHLMKENVGELDKFLLKLSAEKRLLTGDWLIFVGNKFSIGPDRYLTDMHGEINFEKEYGEGEEWATNIIFAMSNTNLLYTTEERFNEDD